VKLLEPLVSRGARNTTSALSIGEWLAQTSYSYGGNSYSLPIQTTMTGQKAEQISGSFEGYVNGGLFGNGVVFGLASTRMRVFSEARFQWQRLVDGRPGDLFSTPDLELFERPWAGGTTGDLLSRMELQAQFAGNAYVVRSGNELVILRPDWVDILVTERRLPTGEHVGYRKAGYHYFEGGQRNTTPVLLLPDEVAHYAPQPDPLATFRGMSWITPVLRELQADGAATAHKLAFFENAATPNLAVSLAKEVTPEQFAEFVEKMDDAHKGTANAYSTLYTAGGADVTVIGADMKQLDFKVTQGAGETRLAQAAGVPPTVAGLSEGMQGSSLNAGNFGQARRQFSDMTLSNLWRNAAGSLEVLVTPPSGSRLWYDTRDIPFLREDQKDEAAIQNTQAQTIRTLVDAGYEAESVLGAVTNQDWSMLKHSGLFSVQLQEPGAAEPAATPLSDVRMERAAPITQIHNHLPAPEVTVEAPNVTVAATEVRNVVETPGVTVNVEPTPVHVDAPNVTVENTVPVPSVTVEGPEVNVAAPAVTAIVEIPARTRRVVRDAQGNITKVIEE
jgi:phage portal protein BeeE